MTNRPESNALVVASLSKSYGATKALAEVDLVCNPGEIVALMGANGAGKSTLVKVLCGITQADGASIKLRGRPIAPRTPAEAEDLGIVAVHQAIADVGVPTLTVAENLLLDRFCRGDAPVVFGPAAILRAAQEVAAEIGLSLNLRARLDSVSLADRQLIAIARAVARKPTVMLFDEPTASLSSSEAERLFAVIERLKARGVAILYISHKTADLRRLADRTVVLRDGRVAGAFTKPVDFTAALTAMIGRDIDTAPRRSVRLGPAVLRIDGGRLRRSERPFDLLVHAGEVLAVTGPVGSGKTSLAGSIFGLWPFAAGSMSLDGAPWRPRGPAGAIARGVFYAGEDRWRTSFFPATVPFASIAGTLSFPFLRARAPHGFISRRHELSAAERAIAQFGIRTLGPHARLPELSGGNQQKVVLARWSAEPARLLLLDEPFQGVDIGARDDIIRAIRTQSANRATIVFVNDYEEAVEVADRIVVMEDNTIGPAEPCPPSLQSPMAA